MKFTAIDPATRQVLYSGEAANFDDFPPGQQIIRGVAHVGEGWIDQDGVFQVLPARPSPNHVFDYPAKQWADPRTLAQIKALKNDAINRARASANSSHFTFQGKQIAVDALSRSDIDAAHGAILLLQAMPPGWPGAWKAMDNTYVLIPDIATWAQFYGTMVATGTNNFNHSQVLKAQLAAATTLAQVEALPDW